MRKLLLILIIFFALPLLLVKAEEQVSIVVSIPPQRYFLEKLAPDKFKVEILIPATANPHTFEPGISQLKTLAKSKLYLTIGHPDLIFEKSIVEKLADRNSSFRIINTSKGISDFNAGDPHLWSSPRNVIIMVGNIRDALVEIDPVNKNLYENNYQSFTEEIKQLDRYFQNLFKDSAGKKFLVYHPAWGYFAKDYHLSQIAVEEHGKDPGVGHAAHIINVSLIRGIRVLFIQPQTPRQSAEVIAREINAQIKVIDPMQQNWLENLKLVANEIKGSF